MIVGTDLLETDEFGRCDSIYDAIALSFKEDRHDRVASLFEAAQERPPWKYKFDTFVSMVFLEDILPRRTACHSSDFLLFTGKNLAKSIPPFSKLFAKD